MVGQRIRWTLRRHCEIWQWRRSVTISSTPPLSLADRGRTVGPVRQGRRLRAGRRREHDGRRVAPEPVELPVTCRDMAGLVPVWTPTVVWAAFTVLLLLFRAILFSTFLTILRLEFLPRDAMHKRGLCRHAVSVCLGVCVCMSVCLSRSWVVSKRINVSSNFFSPSGSYTILVFFVPNGIAILWLKPPNRGVECRWGRQKSRFWAYIWL